MIARARMSTLSCLPGPTTTAPLPRQHRMTTKKKIIHFFKRKDELTVNILLVLKNRAN